MRRRQGNEYLYYAPVSNTRNYSDHQLGSRCLQDYIHRQVPNSAVHIRGIRGEGGQARVLESITNIFTRASVGCTAAPCPAATASSCLVTAPVSWDPSRPSHLLQREPRLASRTSEGFWDLSVVKVCEVSTCEYFSSYLKYPSKSSGRVAANTHLASLPHWGPGYHVAFQFYVHSSVPGNEFGYSWIFGISGL